MMKLEHHISKIALDEIVARALEEDVAGGDITSEGCIDIDSVSTAHAQARQELVVCGHEVVEAVFHRVDPELKLTFLIPEGEVAKPGKVLWRVSGNTRSILMGERVALNFIQRMCGIATMTRAYVQAIPEGCKTKILCTRKTTPGLRVLERHAVRMGGGYNHRDSLSTGVLIKDNHVIACHGVREAIRRAKKYSSHNFRIECEVDNLEQLKEVIEEGADLVLLDNMDTESVRKAVEMVAGKMIVEASGGVTIERIPELARAGVDVISVGALTHSAKSVDIGLDFYLSD